jgi:hypothetical protein
VTIRRILGGLRPADRALLDYALEAGLTNWTVRYRPGRWVGVNILPDTMPHLVVEQTAGAFAAGTYTEDA